MSCNYGGVTFKNFQGSFLLVYMLSKVHERAIVIKAEKTNKIRLVT